MTDEKKWSMFGRDPYANILASDLEKPDWGYKYARNITYVVFIFF